MIQKFKKAKWPVVSMLLLTGFMLVTVSCDRQEELPPNILFILVDDLGYYDMSHTGSKFYQTPNSDRIAQMGMEFTQGYANSPVCSPARASFMTGQYPSRHGITDWIGALTGEEWREHNRHTQMLPPSNIEYLSQDHVTLAKALQDAGYTTFLAGKWHIGGEGSMPEDHGFDINVGGGSFGSPPGGFFDPFTNPYMENRDPGEQLSFRLADETVLFFNEYHPQKTGKPFFAKLSFYAVHSPLQTSYERWKKYRDRADSLGIAEYGFEMGQYLPVRTVQDNPLYGGLVEDMDAAVGHVLNGLKELNLDENTIIVFTSDHGGVSSGDAFATSNLPLRSGKGSLFEGGIRIPFFIAAPGIIPSGTSSEEPVTGTDLFPTLLDMAGLPLLPDQHIDGVSLMPLFNGGTIEERPLFWHYPHYSNQDGRPSSAVRKGDWKLIYDYETEEPELYNLRSDIMESRNVAQQFPDKTELLKTTLMEHLNENDALFPEPDPEFNPQAQRNRLQRVKENRMANLERRRLLFLSPDFDPENNWWGSQPDQ